MKDINWKNHLLEFLLIIMGILIALRINNWNEHRQNQILQSKYIIALLVDVQSDIQSIETTLRRNKLGSDIPLQSALTSWKNGKIHQDTSLTTWNSYLEPIRYTDIEYRFLAELSHLSYIQNFQTNNSTFTDIVSSGNSNILQDFSLKTMLSSYYSLVGHWPYYSDLFARDAQENGFLMTLFSELPDSRMARERNWRW